MKFGFPSGDGESMVAGMTRLEGSERPEPRGDPHESWWKIKADGPLEIYKIPGQGGYVAVDWVKKEAYYWNR